MTSACGPPDWTPRDAKLKTLVSAACIALHGHYEPHTKISSRTRYGKAGKTVSRGRTMGRPNPQEAIARRKNRATLRRVGLRLVPFQRKPRLQGPRPRCRGKAHRLVRNSDARLAARNP